MNFNYHRIPHWPPLAWLVEISVDECIDVHHGKWVETQGKWFIEGVWAGDFTAGDFDQTDLVSGSGARIRGDNVWFVSSGSNVDRLHSLRKQDNVYISNSLCCLLNWVDGDAKLEYLNYVNDFAEYRYTIFGESCRYFPSTAGSIQLTYFANLLWDGEDLQVNSKPSAKRQFKSFDNYNGFLKESMASITENAMHAGRRRPFEIICSLSNGYDSPTVAALAKSVRKIEAFTVEKDRDGDNDSGAEIASMLNIPCHMVNRQAWYDTRLAEVPFVACSGSVGDLVFKSAEKLLRGKVLLLGGPGGDTGWTKNASLPTSMAVGGGALLGLTEYRLWAGFIGCSVPMWGIRQIRDIMHISNSPEMEPWDTGGNYSRPICRRIVEQAGVSRSSFGVEKRGVSFVPSTSVRRLSEASMNDFVKWLEDKANQSPQGEGLKISVNIAIFLDSMVQGLQKIIDTTSPRLNDWRLGKLRVFNNIVQKKFGSPYYHHHYLVHWAIDRSKQRYNEESGMGMNIQSRH